MFKSCFAFERETHSSVTYTEDDIGVCVTIQFSRRDILRRPRLMLLAAMSALNGTMEQAAESFYGPHAFVEEQPLPLEKDSLAALIRGDGPAAARPVRRGVLRSLFVRLFGGVRRA